MKKTTTRKPKTGNNITLEIGKEQTGNIKVATQIINDLSSGIYSSPASCVKELVNNSYDANAKLVTIRIKPVQDVITILDDGDGMNAIDFDNNFAWISKSNKRNSSEFSRTGRPLIGKIGIGFIAVNEICDRLEVSSSKRGEAVKFVATIDFKKFQKESHKATEEGIIKAGYSLINEEEARDAHYTLITLVGIKDEVKNILDNRQYVETLKKGRAKSTFKNMKELLLYSEDKALKAFGEEDAYLQFVFNLASYIPVEYIDGGPVEGSRDRIISDIVKMHKGFDFKVDLDGVYLKKPIFFPRNEKAKVKTFEESIKTSSGQLKFKGYFYIQDHLLTPRELNGVSLRIRNIPIAIRYGYDTSFLGYPTYTDQIFKNWISGEVYVSAGLEDAMNIDRQSFRETHPDYIALQNFIHRFLREQVFSKTAMPIYESGRKAREQLKHRDTRKSLKAVLDAKKVSFEEVSSASGETLKPLSLKQSKGNVTVSIDKSYFKKIKKKDWDYLKNIFLIFELAHKASRGDADKLQEVFYEKIKTWVEEK